MKLVSAFILALFALAVVVILTNDTTVMDVFFAVFGN